MNFWILRSGLYSTAPKALEYQISFQLSTFKNLRPPYWIRQSEFLNFKLGSVISDPINTRVLNFKSIEPEEKCVLQRVNNTRAHARTHVRARAHAQAHTFGYQVKVTIFDAFEHYFNHQWSAFVRECRNLDTVMLDCRGVRESRVYSKRAKKKSQCGIRPSIWHHSLGDSNRQRVKNSSCQLSASVAADRPTVQCDIVVT